MESLEIVQKIRAFNRFYMPTMNLLGNHYLGSEYSVTEARIFFEIYAREGCNAAHIAQVMNIDKSYLSRIIISQEKSGCLIRKKSDDDRRSFGLYLTDEGRKRTEALIEASNKDIGEIIKNLSEEEQAAMGEAIDVITRLLTKKGETK